MNSTLNKKMRITTVAFRIVQCQHYVWNSQTISKQYNQHNHRLKVNLQCVRYTLERSNTSKKYIILTQQKRRN